jgi:alpha-tubulin suppressor-like RCC1 family protein
VLTNVVAIAAGDLFGVALRSNGTVWAWGANDTGQLGIGAAGPTENTPIAVCEQGSTNSGASCTAFLGSASPITAISARGFNALALRTDQRLLSWGGGIATSKGQGSIATADRPDFVCDVEGDPTDCKTLDRLANVTAIAMGGGSGLAVLNGSTVVGWGSNNYGEVGASTGGSAPTDVPRYPCAVGANDPCLPGSNNLTGITQVAMGAQHAMAWNASSGESPRWGHNEFGASGVDNANDVDCAAIRCVRIPTQPAGTSGMAPLAGGGGHTLGYHAASGTVKAWGDNQYGQLGIGTLDSDDHSTAVTVPGLTDIVAFAGGFHHSVALDAGGTVWTWGQSESGRLARDGDETCGAISNACDSTPQTVTFE